MNTILSDKEKSFLTSVVGDKFEVDISATKKNPIFIIESVSNGFVIVVLNGGKEKHIAKDYTELLDLMKKYQK